MKRSEITMLAGEVGPVVREVIEPLIARIAKLETKGTAP